MFLSKILTVLTIVFVFTNSIKAQNKSISTYVTTIDSLKESPIDYVISLYEKHDIVVLCERGHPEITQYDAFINKLIADKRFTSQVKYVYTELGDCNAGIVAKTFLGKASDSLTVRDKIINIQRNHTSNSLLWEKYSFYSFLFNLYEVNSRLPKSKQLQWYPCDEVVNWRDINTYQEYIEADKENANDRDHKMAVNFSNHYDSVKLFDKAAKALIIMNYRHAFMNLDWGNKRWLASNFGKYIKVRYEEKATNVLINTATETKREKVVLINKGRWDAAFAYCNNRAVGFNFADTPFGDDNFDLFPWISNSLKYKDVFKGMVFTNPIVDFSYVYGYDGLVDSTFYEEYKRRYKLVFENNKDKLSRVPTLVNLKEQEIEKEDGLEFLNKQLQKHL